MFFQSIGNYHALSAVPVSKSSSHQMRFPLLRGLQTVHRIRALAFLFPSSVFKEMLVEHVTHNALSRQLRFILNFANLKVIPGIKHILQTPAMDRKYLGNLKLLATGHATDLYK
jgi:hypothetical protein